MSSKQSLYYRSDGNIEIHIYSDVTDNNRHLVIETSQFKLDQVITAEECKSLIKLLTGKL